MTVTAFDMNGSNACTLRPVYLQADTAVPQSVHFESPEIDIVRKAGSLQLRFAERFTSRTALLKTVMRKKK